MGEIRLFQICYEGDLTVEVSEAMRRLGAEPASTAAIEDSSNGIRAAHAAGMRVIALPNAHYPPAPDALVLADAVIASPDELTPELVRD